MDKSKIAIIHRSYHHNNTVKLIRSYAEGIDFYPVDDLEKVDWGKYELVGFASGIYAGRMALEIEEAMKKYADARKPEKAEREEAERKVATMGKPKEVFLVYTSGTDPTKYAEKVRRRAEKLGLEVRGVFGCRGFNTFGPFKLIGGKNKGQPDATDLQNYQKFVRQIIESN